MCRCWAGATGTGAAGSSPAAPADDGIVRDAAALARGVKRERDEKAAPAAKVLTPAQKKLAATNIKGMKTMGAFFGKKA